MALGVRLRLAGSLTVHPADRAVAMLDRGRGSGEGKSDRHREEDEDSGGAEQRAYRGGAVWHLSTPKIGVRFLWPSMAHDSGSSIFLNFPRGLFLFS